MSLRQSFFWLFAVLAGAYVVFGLALFLFQDSFIYFPDRAPAVIKDGWPIEEVLVQTDDHETLVAWHMDPQPGCPTMLMFHGNGSHLAKAEWQYSRIHEAGAGMFALSWRGYAGSTGSPSEKGLFRDAQAGYETLIRLGVEPSDIVVHGFSLGSGPAIKIAAENDVRALILEAPYYSALRRAQEQILIAHGSTDSVIPVRDSEALAQLATAPVQRIVFEGSEHTTLVRDGLYEDAIWPFLKPIYTDCAFGTSAEATAL